MDRIAEGGLVTPVMRPERERWFEAALAVEETPSMAVWSRTVTEFHRLLTHQGAFSDVRCWRLAEVDGRPRLRSPNGVEHQHGELRHPAGRRLIMVVSDCVSMGWRDGVFAQAIVEWSATTPVVIVEVLPERMWPRTAVGTPSTRVISLLPGLPNRGFNVIDKRWWEDASLDSSVPVPIVALEPGSVGRCARMLMASGASATAILLEATKRRRKDRTEPQDAERALARLSPDERVNRFRMMASSTAFQLAVYLAAVPLSPPVMRLVQATMLPYPRSEQAHLAEVLLGGIIERITPATIADHHDEIEYDFYEGVRDLLLASILRDEADSVLQAASKFIERRLGHGLDFEALLADADGELALPKAARPFARIAAQVLKRTGSPTWLRLEKRRADGLPNPALADSDGVSGDSMVPDYELLPALNDGIDDRAKLKLELEREQNALQAAFETSGDPELVIRGRTRLVDAVNRGVLEFGFRYFRLAPQIARESFAAIAVGGYGRSELAPHSNVDLLLLTRSQGAPDERLVEFLVTQLREAGLAVSHSIRSVDECLRLARADLQICTSLLEARFLWGGQVLFEHLERRFDDDVVAGRQRIFVEAKLAERDARHQRAGDDPEPDVKEGKGGLRDLHTLAWLGRFTYRIGDPAELVAHGVLTQPTLRRLVKARHFLWTVRCHLHYLTGRPEERLTFDLQPEVARLMGYRDRKSSSSIERFMKRYYLVAKEVSELTRIFCVALEEQQRRPHLGLARLGLGRRRIDGMVIEGGRIKPATPDLFECEPVAMLKLFQLAQERDLDIHPEAWRAVTQSLRYVDAELREDPAANALFLKMLTSRKDPATTLTRMNEVGLLGRFLPEFGRVVGQMEHSLYHVYTVDQHTIRALGVLHQIETGQLEDELPLTTALMPKVLSRTELYVALLLHDLGKGRGGDHSEIGAAMALRVGPRLGLSDEQTETVAWLVRHHLLLSRVAFKRDIEDPKTVSDVVEVVQSPELLRLLLVLTAADIRAVGPNVWNGWKGQLLRNLYHEAYAVVAGGEASGRRADRVDAARQALAEALADWPPDQVQGFLARHDPRYWVSFGPDTHRRHAELVREADAARSPVTLDFRSDRFRARTELVLYAADHPGLFMKVAGALALGGASIVDARIFTTTDGMALDSFGFQDAESRAAIVDPARIERIRRNIERALAGEIWLDQALAELRSLPQRADVFEVEPRVLIDNGASRTRTVLELNGRDRPSLLYEVAKALKDLGMVISSLHISTYGERVVDVFYVSDVFGLKITQPSKMRQIQRRLIALLAAGASGSPSPPMPPNGRSAHGH